MMQLSKTPALWLVTLIVGLPLLSETVYTPALPAISQALHTSDSMVEYTLTIYLFAFALGTLFWGRISDQTGRKGALIAGLGIYLLGCVGCWASSSIEGLMISRFIQAFGGSTGSVLGQAICRDAFQGPALGKVYASISSAMAIFPAIGPVMGGLVAQSFHWSMIFGMLILWGAVVLIGVITCLPETCVPTQNPLVILPTLIRQMAKDKQLIGFCLLVAGCNGISFSYYAEGSFYLIEMLGATPAFYGTSYIALSLAIMIGGFISRKLHAYAAPFAILQVGLKSVLLSTIVFGGGIVANHFWAFPFYIVQFLTLSCMRIIMGGTCIITSTALSVALAPYKHCSGAASSLFGCAYYALISLFTAGMGMLHNHTLFPMPFYFLGIAVFMMGVLHIFIKK